MVEICVECKSGKSELTLLRITSHAIRPKTCVYTIRIVSNFPVDYLKIPTRRIVLPSRKDNMKQFFRHSITTVSPNNSIVDHLKNLKIIRFPIIILFDN